MRSCRVFRHLSWLVTAALVLAETAAADPEDSIQPHDAWGDFDGDGLDDLYLVRPGPGDRLYRNLGDGTLQDVTSASGIHESARSRSALWRDFDLDGALDLLLIGLTGATRLIYTINFP